MADVIGLSASLTIGAVSLDTATLYGFDGIVADVIDTSHLGTTGAREKMGGMVDSGKITWTAKYDATDFNGLHALVGTTASCVATSPLDANQQYEFDAVVSKVAVSFDTPTLVMMTGELDITGDIDIGSIGS